MSKNLLRLGKTRLIWSQNHLSQLTGVLLWINHTMDCRFHAMALLHLSKYEKTRDHLIFDVARAEIANVWGLMTKIGIMKEPLRRREIVIKMEEQLFNMTTRKRHRAGFKKMTIKRRLYSNDIGAWECEENKEVMGEIVYQEKTVVLSLLEDLVEVIDHMPDAEQELKNDKKFVQFQNVIQNAITEVGCNAVTFIVDSLSFSKTISTMSKTKWKFRKLITTLMDFLAVKYGLNSRVILHNSDDDKKSFAEAKQSFLTNHLENDVRKVQDYIYSMEVRRTEQLIIPEATWIIKIPKYRTIYGREVNKKFETIPAFIDQLPNEWPVCKEIIIIADQMQFALHAMSRIWAYLLSLSTTEVHKAGIERIWVITTSKKVRKKIALYYYKCATVEVSSMWKDNKNDVMWHKIKVIPHRIHYKYVMDPTAMNRAKM